jgi:hypothetical protein
MGSKDDFWDFKSSLSSVLLILGGMVIFNVIYDSYDSYVREKENERRQEIYDLNKELEREQEREREREREKNNNNEQDLKDKNPTEKTDQPEEVRKIICPNCNGTSSEILPCGHCKYNIYCERQGSGGYTEYARTGKDIKCRPCSYCKGRGELPRACRTCGGEGRVDEYE